eukprot:CAMPEP_0113876872 /NCGR_PEP_ID=MMETSP0780_2-20120614/5736_1 /TAXON_ID=652834 /ORGANISM="Palpitomonas bilix" /LENGTH=468 /DNA_ID=CAMNT_0000863015 /DNA_START=94 /DNA_END=1500 /DNA_ORIENTATION=- /assembly_acc=CAM_ASM_000599
MAEEGGANAPPATPEKSSAPTAVPATAPSLGAVSRTQSGAVPAAGGKAVAQQLQEAGTAPKRKRSDAAKRKAAPKRKKAVDSTITQDVAQYLPESKAFSQLRELEHKLDTLIANKAADFKLMNKSVEMEKRQLLISVYNLFRNQPGTVSFASPIHGKEPPSWTVRLEGALVPKRDDNGNPVPEPDAPKLSSFFNKVAIVVDKGEGVEERAEWDMAILRREGADEVDGFETHALSTVEANIKFELHLKTHPQRFKLDSKLASFFGVRTETLQGAIKRVWTYIKDNNLLGSGAGSVNCDEALQFVFGKPMMRVVEIGDMVKGLMKELMPIVFPYKVNLTAKEKEEQAFEIQVELPTKYASAQVCDFLEEYETMSNKMKGIEEDIIDLLKEMNDLRRKRELCLMFAQNPSAFLHDVISAQTKQVKTVASASTEGFGVAERRSYLYRQQWVSDAAAKIVTRPDVKKEEVKNA